MIAASSGRRRNISTPVRSAFEALFEIRSGQRDALLEFLLGARHIASGVSAGIRFSAAIAASRLRGVACTDSTSHTNRMNGSCGGRDRAP